MSEFLFDYAFLAAAREVYDALLPADRQAVDALIDAICRDPFVDNVTKFILMRDPIELLIADDGVWSIGYRIVDHAVIEIRALTRVG